MKCYYIVGLIKNCNWYHLVVELLLLLLLPFVVVVEWILVLDDLVLLIDLGFTCSVLILKWDLLGLLLLAFVFELLLVLLLLSMLSVAVLLLLLLLVVLSCWISTLRDRLGRSPALLLL